LCARNELPVVQKTYELLLWMVPTVQKLPKSHRFVLGERLESSLYRLLEDLVRARFAKPAARAEPLADADATLHLLRFQVRLAHDLRLLDTRRYELAARRCAELGAMVGGWRKAGERRRDEAEGRAVPPGL